MTRFAVFALMDLTALVLLAALALAGVTRPRFLGALALATGYLLTLFLGVANHVNTCALRASAPTPPAGRQPAQGLGLPGGCGAGDRHRRPVAAIGYNYQPLERNSLPVVEFRKLVYRWTRAGRKVPITFEYGGVTHSTEDIIHEPAWRTRERDWEMRL